MNNVDTEVWNKLQAQYGEKPKPQREIKKSLGKDDFLRIMIEQMKNQDPSEPFKAEQFAAELAQYASVEQLQNLNNSMGKLTNQNQPLERLAMTGMIGKTITVDRERFQHNQGSNTTLSFDLPKDSAQGRVLVLAESGETVFEQELGPLKKGENSVVWDGIQKNTLPAKSGNYLIRVEAVDENGKQIQTNPKSQTKVVGVSFESNEPVFLVGNLNQPGKVPMKNIVRVDSGKGGEMQ